MKIPRPKISPTPSPTQQQQQQQQILLARRYTSNFRIRSNLSTKLSHTNNNKASSLTINGSQSSPIIALERAIPLTIERLKKMKAADYESIDDDSKIEDDRSPASIEQDDEESSENGNSEDIMNDMINKNNENKFKQLYILLTCYKIFDNFQDEMIIDMFNSIRDFLIFKEGKDVNPIYLSSLDKCQLVRKKWEEIAPVYSILSLFIFQDKKRQKLYVNERLIHGLVKILNSPDSSEQHMVSDILFRIFRTPIFTPYKHEIVNSIVNLLNDYNENMVKQTNKDLGNIRKEKISTQYFCVGISLKLLNQIFNDSSFLNEIDLSKVAMVVFRLFCSEFLFDFFEALNTTLSIIYMVDKDYATKAVTYLLNHWPVTNSKLQICFLDHTLLIMREFLLNFDEKTKAKIEKKIHESLQSQNSAVIASAVAMLVDKNIFSTVSYYFDSMKEKMIADLTQNQYSNWSIDIRDLASRAISILSTYEYQGAKLNDNFGHSATIHIQFGWKEIREMSKEKQAV